MPVAVNDIVRLSVIGSLNNSVVMYGHHFRAKTTSGTFATLAASYIAGVQTLLTAATSASVTWLEVTVAGMRSDADETHHEPFPAATVGALAGDVLPGQNSMLVSVHTGKKGRRSRGRFYVPGVSETSSINGRIIAPQLTALNALAEGIQTQFTGSGNANWELVVYSPASPPYVAPPPPKLKLDTISTPVNNLIADSLVVTQRRRRLGVGS
jgi:hypothetical protein